MNSPDSRAGTFHHPTGAPADTLEQPFDIDSLFILRHSVAAHASALGLTDGRVYELVLVAQELAANAIRHGPGHGALRLWRDGDRLHCEVTNLGTAPDHLAAAGTHPQPPNIPGGRGLWLVRQYAQSLHIDSTTDATRITAIVTVTGPDTTNPPSPD